MINTLYNPRRMNNYYNETNGLRFFRRIKNHYYDQENQMLSIAFHNGTTQNYFKVPGKVYRGLESSLDQNEYYNKNIYGIYRLGRLVSLVGSQHIR